MSILREYTMKSFNETKQQEWFKNMIKVDDFLVCKSECIETCFQNDKREPFTVLAECVIPTCQC